MLGADRLAPLRGAVEEIEPDWVSRAGMPLRHERRRRPEGGVGLEPRALVAERGIYGCARGLSPVEVQGAIRQRTIPRGNEVPQVRGRAAVRGLARVGPD